MLQMTAYINGLNRTIKGNTFAEILNKYRKLLSTLNVPQHPTMVNAWIGSR